MTRNFKDATTPFEVAEAILNKMATSWSIRLYDYGPMAIYCALHNSRFFFNVAPDEKTQLALLLDATHKCFDKNTTRGAEAKPPLKVSEVIEVCSH